MGILRNILDTALRGIGYRVIADSNLRRLSDLAAFSKSESGLSHHLRQVISLHEIDCVFDVGANEGQFATFLRKEVDYSGWIVSFEPLPDLADSLEKRSNNDDQWKVLPLALGSRRADAILRRTAESVFSSLHPPSENQPNKYRAANQTVETIPVTTNSVDLIWPKLKAELAVSRCLLKMDTQGHDLEVFAGAQNSLHDIPAVLTELSFMTIYEESSSYRKALSTFEKAGYSPSAFSPVSFGDDYAAIEMDGLFVRTPK